MDLTVVLASTAALACVSLVVTSTEYLAISNEFGSAGAFAWRIFGSRPECVNNAWLFRRIEFLFGRRGCALLQCLRVVFCALALFSLAAGGSPAVYLGAILVLSLVHSYRGLVGADGSDQMMTVVFCALFFAYGSHDPAIRKMCVLFIGAQAILSYSVAGVAKLLSPKWRSGNAIREIMNTHCYGHPIIATLLNRASSATNLFISWQVMCFEVGFILIPILPSHWSYVLLLWGGVFHLLNAIFMGLNTFFWAFVATYPCLIFVGSWASG